MALVMNFDETLAMGLRSFPEIVVPVLEAATKKVYHNNYHETITGGENVPNWQVQIYSDENPRNLRDLKFRIS